MLLRELPNDYGLRISKNQVISENSQNWMELQPRPKKKSTVKPPNSGHPKQQTCHEQRTKRLVPNVTIFFKLPPNSGRLSITDKFFKTRRCLLFRGFTAVLVLEIGQVKKFLSLTRPHSPMCIRIYIFNFKNQINKQKKQ